MTTETKYSLTEYNWIQIIVIKHFDYIIYEETEDNFFTLDYSVLIVCLLCSKEE